MDIAAMVRMVGRAAVAGRWVDRFRIRDVFSVPGLLSLSRAPLAIAFMVVFPRLDAAIAVLVFAAISDVLDGWCARRSGRATVTGAVLDPLMDKVFVGAVAITMLVGGLLTMPMLLCLGARELLELPLAVWLMFDREALADRSGRVRANKAGKAATVLQFATIAAAFCKPAYAGALAAASGLMGATAAATYWTRALRRLRHRGRPIRMFR